MRDFNPVITLSYEDGEGRKCVHTLPGDGCWPELFDMFRDFLNGIGFSVPIGEWEEDEDIAPVKLSSGFTYDTEEAEYKVTLDEDDDDDVA